MLLGKGTPPESSVGVFFLKELSPWFQIRTVPPAKGRARRPELDNEIQF